MSIDLCIYDKCNNKCLMCTNPSGSWPAWDNSFDYSYKAIIKRLEGAKEKISLADSIYITGGEPTLHPRFLDILKYLKRYFSKQQIKLLTNGRRFSYENFAIESLNINQNFEIDLSIYGPDSEVHDSVTRSKDSFKQTCLGLNNLLIHKKPRQIIGVRIVLTKLSYRYIGEMLDLIKNKFSEVDRVVIIFPEIEAQVIKNFEKINITYQDVKPYIEDVFLKIKYFKEIRFYHFPLCTLSNKIWPYIWRTISEQEVKFLKTCEKCNYKKYCLGIPEGYLKHVGMENFTPVTEKIIILSSNDIHKPIDSVNN